MEDQQVVAYLGNLLRQRGLTTHWALPENLSWQQGHAYLKGRRDRGPLGLIVRLFQAEWLKAPLLLIIIRWWANAGVQSRNCRLDGESKRFPLVWDKLSTPLPTWRRLLPTTVDPSWPPTGLTMTSWLIKSALCDCGDTVAIRSLLSDDQWRGAARVVRRNPRTWVAQKRFTTCPLQTPTGAIYPCIGVYTVNGCAAGIYGRISRSPLIDFAAVDVAVLIVDA